MAVALRVSLDLESPVPAYRQIANDLRRSSGGRRLKPGDLLPPVRQLAVDLGVHFNTVALAYRMLADEGWLELKRRRGATVIARNAPRRRSASGRSPVRQLAHIAAELRSAGMSFTTDLGGAASPCARSTTMTSASWTMMLVVTMNAIFFHAMPRLSRPDILFAVTVPDAFVAGAGRTLVSRYRAIAWSGAAAALAIILLLPAPLPDSGWSVADDECGGRPHDRRAGRVAVGAPEGARARRPTRPTCASPRSSRATRRCRVGRCSPLDRLPFCWRRRCSYTGTGSTHRMVRARSSHSDRSRSARFSSR